MGVMILICSLKQIGKMPPLGLFHFQVVEDRVTWKIRLLMKSYYLKFLKNPTVNKQVSMLSLDSI